jgi:glucose-1-phosphatase
MKIECIWFDVGGVLMNFDLSNIGKSLMDFSPHDPGSINALIVNSPEHLLFMKGLIDPMDFYLHVKSTIGKGPRELLYDDFKQLWQDIFKLNWDIAPLLQNLKQDVPKYIITNTDRLHWDYLFRRFIINHYIPLENRILSFRVKAIKPETAIFQKALNACGISPENILYIDDSPVYLSAAQGLGCQTFLYNSRRETKATLWQKFFDLNLLR